jgi:hypothetical protein
MITSRDADFFGVGVEKDFWMGIDHKAVKFTGDWKEAKKWFNALCKKVMKYNNDALAECRQPGMAGAMVRADHGMM